MPTSLPLATRAGTRRGQAALTPLAAACTAIGAAAAALALFVGWGCGDIPAAALVVMLAGAVIGLLRRAATPR